jgi:hypothetical protein
MMAKQYICPLVEQDVTHINKAGQSSGYGKKLVLLSSANAIFIPAHQFQLRLGPSLGAATDRCTKL